MKFLQGLFNREEEEEGEVPVSSRFLEFSSGGFVVDYGGDCGGL